MKKIAILLSVLMAISSNGWAEQKPRPLNADNRIKVAIYNDKQIYSLTGNYGYSTHIRFSPEEKILDVNIGDSDAWGAEISANSLFIKNKVDSATNMTVITDKHNYMFNLETAKNDKQQTYLLDFTYPKDKKSKEELYFLKKRGLSDKLNDIKPGDVNWKYNYAPASGKDLAPLSAFDDGKFTYFKFSDKKSLPAIFAVDEKGNESLVNYTKDGEYVVLHRTDKRYHLRLGDKAIAVFNENTSEA